MRAHRSRALAALTFTAFGSTSSPAADVVEPVEYVRICDAYGGSYFYYIPGTETCLKISGYVRVDVQSDSMDPDASGTGVTSRIPVFFTPYIDWRDFFPAPQLNLETSQQTEYGQLFGYIHLTPDSGVAEQPPKESGQVAEGQPQTGGQRPRTEQPTQSGGLSKEETRLVQMFNSTLGGDDTQLPHVEERQDQQRDPKTDGPTRATIDSEGNGNVSMDMGSWRNFLENHYLPIGGGTWESNNKFILTFTVRHYGSGIITVGDQFGETDPAQAVLNDTPLPAGAQMSADQFSIGDNNYIRSVWAIPPKFSFDVGKSLELRFGLNYTYDWGGRAQPVGPLAAKKIGSSAEPLPHATLSLAGVRPSEDAQ